MKKTLVALLALAMIVIAVSCSTTQASDVEPVVREVKISEYTAKEYNADQVYSMLKRFVKDTYEDDEDVKVSYDEQAKSITVSGLELSSNVGALAQDGWIEVDLKFEAQDDKAVFSMLFVDSYTYMYIGPIKKKSSQGITEYGMKTLEYQSNYIADQFQSLLGTYSYYLDNGLI